MKRFILITICIAAICAAMFYMISVPHNLSEIKAEGGVIRLPYAEGDKIFTLDGEWEFYYGELYIPEDFSNGKPEGGDIIPVPSSWDEYGYPLYGCATYRLTAYADEERLMMLIPEIIDSSTVWINGEKVFEAGVPGRTEAETTPSVRNSFVNVGFKAGRAEIIVQAANHSWRTSGFVYSATLGRDGVIAGGAITRRLMLAFVIGILISMSLYHAVLFLYQRREKVYIAFSLVCLFASVRFMLETNSFADLFIRGGVGAGLTKVMLMCFILHVAAVLFFAYSALSMTVRGKLQRAVYISAFSAAAAAAMFSLPPEPVTLILIPLAWTIVDGIRSGKVRENPYNALFLFALALAATVYPYIIFILDDSLFVPGVATNLFLTLSQCVMLSASYAETKRREEELARKADFYHQMSHDLLTPLTIVSSSIQVAAFQPEKAPELLRNSQAEIMKMAGIISEALKEDDNE